EQLVSVDGDLSEWENLDHFSHLDANDVPGTGAVDLLEVKITHDDEDLFVAYQNDGAYTNNWGVVLFLETDSDITTGFQLFGVFGADYAIQDDSILKYNGLGADWTWTVVGEVNSAVSGSVVEFSLPRSLMGDPQSIRLLSYNDNSPIGVATTDTVPDGPPATAHFLSYGFTRSAISIDGDLREWSDLHLVGEEAVDVEGAANLIDLRKMWVRPDETQFLVGYETEKDLVLNTGFVLFLDTDLDPGSGYKLHGALGADYMIQGDKAFRYEGAGSDWSWVFTGQGVAAVSGKTAEISVAKGYLGNPAGMRMAFYGDNGVHAGGEGVDFFPDNLAGEVEGPRYFTIGMNNSLVVNGSTDEWDPSWFVGEDPDDLLGANGRIDLRAMWMTNDTRQMFVGLRNDVAAELNWGTVVFMDTDKKSATGFRTFEIGSDYILHGKTLYRYSGEGTDWDWEKVGDVDVAVQGTDVEYALPRSWIGNPASLNFIFYGENAAFGGSGVDLFPDNADGSAQGARYESYSLR
ncbi:MAG: hypothetical protein AAF514_16270, partial [Verrucomicrobiota bacterium]